MKTLFLSYIEATCIWGIRWKSMEVKAILTPNTIRTKPPKTLKNLTLFAVRSLDIPITANRIYKASTIVTAMTPVNVVKKVFLDEIFNKYKQVGPTAICSIIPNKIPFIKFLIFLYYTQNGHD